LNVESIGYGQKTATAWRFGILPPWIPVSQSVKNQMALMTITAKYEDAVFKPLEDVQGYGGDDHGGVSAE
jgi:hypothetical protein